MKKIIVIICVTALALGLFTGCIKKEKPVTPEVNGQEVEVINPDFELIEKYVSENKESFDIFTRAPSEDVDAKVKAEDGKLIYSYQFKKDIKITDEIKDELDSGIRKQDDAIIAKLGELSNFGIEKPVIVMEYLDYTGERITAFEFK